MNMTAMVAFSGVFALGVIFSLLGSVKLKLASALGIDNAKVGKLISTLMFSSLIAVLIVGPLSDLVGYRAIGIAGFLLGGTSIWLLAGAKTYRTALIACLFLGIAAMCVNAVGNVLGPMILFGGNDPARASNLLNVGFSIGAIITPLIIVSRIGKTGHKNALIFIGIILLIPVTYSLFATFPDPGENFVISEAFLLLTNAVVILCGLSLFCYVSMEASMTGFITTYLKSYSYSDSNAGYLLSGFWVFLILSRLVYAFFFRGLEDPAVVIPVIAAMSVIAITIMVMARSSLWAAAGVLLAGFSFGPVFPTLVGVAFLKTGAINAGNSGSVFAIIFAIGLLGGSTVPALIGKYAEKTDIRQSLKIAIGFAFALIIISTVLWLAVPVS